MFRKWLTVVLFLASMHLSCWAQGEVHGTVDGGITGIVVNEDGQLAVGAKPCVSVHSGNQTSIKCYDSANGGRFTIQPLKPGTYQVFAINEAEGYSIANQAPGRDVTISSDDPWPNVTIRLLSRGGVLVGSITDKLTGKPIRASLQYTAVDRDGDGGSSFVQGDFHVTIPANCDVLVVATAKGYRGWVYTEAATPSRPVLKLAPGEQKTMHIQLEPLPNNPAPR